MALRPLLILLFSVCSLSAAAQTDSMRVDDAGHSLMDEPAWHWYLAVLGLLLLAATLYIFWRSRHKYRLAAEKQDELGRQLAETCERDKVHIWTYDVRSALFSWYGHGGKATGTYSVEEFGRRYSKDDYRKLKDGLERLIRQHKDTKGNEEQEVSLELDAADAEYGQGELHHYVIVLRVLKRDSKGHPTIIIGTKKDVNKENRLRQLNNERSLRYWSMFYNDESGVILFDKEGYIQNANPKACALFRLDIDKVVKKHVHISELINTNFASLRKADGHQGTLTISKNNIEYRLKTVTNDRSQLLEIILFCI